MNPRHTLLAAALLLSAFSLQVFSPSAFAAADDATRAQRAARRAAREQAAAAVAAASGTTAISGTAATSGTTTTSTTAATSATTTTSGTTTASGTFTPLPARSTRQTPRIEKSAPTAPIPAAVPMPATPVKTYLPPHPWGVYLWGGNILKDNYPAAISAEIRGYPLTLKWSAIEPEQGHFAFDREIRAPLEEARRRGLFIHFTLHVAPTVDTPRWIYTRYNVPEVVVPQRISPGRKVQNLTFPYYFDPTFQKLLRATVKALADYIAALPDDLKQRIVFVQMAEGSTGDGGPYKGAPINPAYNISKADWSVYRRNLWSYYITQFQRPDGTLAIPILVNGDSDGEAENAWLLAHSDNFGVKQGMFSHGYLVSDAIDRLAAWENLRARARAAGHQVFSRGEQDGEWAVCGWCAKNPPAAIYWGALFALHCKIDVWNVSDSALSTQPIAEALRLFNRYAGYNDDPAAAPGAFCALRRGLNAADTTAFPEDKFGKADRDNIARYLAIAKAFAPYGAVQEDPKKAIGGGMTNRQADGQNDVGWNILPGNFERFLTQINPEETSLGLWHLDKRPYSVFARRFDTASGRTTMTFRLADKFFANPSSANPVTLRVAYLDKGTGAWSLVYATASGEKVAQQITNTDTNEWRDLNLTLPDAVWDHRLPAGGDLALRHVSGDDTTFHIIELARK